MVDNNILFPIFLIESLICTFGLAKYFQINPIFGLSFTGALSIGLSLLDIIPIITNNSDKYFQLIR